MSLALCSYPLVLSSHVVSVIYTPVIAVRFLTPCLHVNAMFVRVVFVLDIPVVTVTFLLSNVDFKTIAPGRFASNGVPSRWSTMHRPHTAASTWNITGQVYCRLQVGSVLFVFFFLSSSGITISDGSLKFFGYPYPRPANQVALVQPRYQTLSSQPNVGGKVKREPGSRLVGFPCRRLRILKSLA